MEKDPVCTAETFGEDVERVMRTTIPARLSLYAGSTSGERQSAVIGEGSEADGVREYELGDNLARVDWPSVASSPDRALYVRESYKDVTPRITFITDTLQQRYKVNPGHYSEQDLALSALAMLTAIANRNNHEHSLLVTNDQKLSIDQRPSIGRRSTMKMASTISELAEPNTSESNPEANLRSLLEAAGSLCKEHVIVVISDFRQAANPNHPGRGWSEALQGLTSRQKGNSLIAVELINDYDRQLPKHVGKFRTSVVHRIADKQRGTLRQRYVQAANLQQKSIDQAIQDAKGTHIKLETTDVNWANTLGAGLRGPLK